MIRFACTFLAALFLLKASTTEAGLTAADKTELVDEHNKARASVSPAASNMKKMVWDDDLADIAQGFADRCVWGHNSARGDSYPGYVGENLYLTTASSVDYTAVVESWEDEKDYYDYDTNSCAANRQCGHYTQLVWANTNKVGCGSTFCSTVAGIPFGNANIVVCNYSPGGNYRGVKPYQKGASCSSCPSGTSCQDQLCASTSEVMDIQKLLMQMFQGVYTDVL